jgi:hypothetical protein
MPFSGWMGKPLKIRSAKVVKGDTLYSNTIEGIRFVPSAFPYSVKEIQRTACDNAASFEVYIGNLADAKYIHLPANTNGRYSWVLSNAATPLSGICNAALFVSEFQIRLFTTGRFPT